MLSAVAQSVLPGRVVQSVTCPATDVCLTADPGVASLIQARSHIFVEVDYEVPYTVILLTSARVFNKIFCKRPNTSFRRSDFQLLYRFEC